MIETETLKKIHPRATLEFKRNGIAWKLWVLVPEPLPTGETHCTCCGTEFTKLHRVLKGNTIEEVLQAFEEEFNV